MKGIIDRLNSVSTIRIADKLIIEDAVALIYAADARLLELEFESTLCDLLAEGLSEIKAIIDDEESGSVRGVVYGLIEEIETLPKRATSS